MSGNFAGGGRTACSVLCDAFLNASARLRAALGRDIGLLAVDMRSGGTPVGSKGWCSDAPAPELEPLHRPHLFGDMLVSCAVAPRAPRHLYLRHLCLVFPTVLHRGVLCAFRRASHCSGRL